MSGWILKFESTFNTFFTTSDASGNFEAFLPLGVYTTSVHELHSSWESCFPTFDVDLVGSGSMVDLDVPIKAKVDCTAMEVNISSSSLEQCTSNNIYTVDYCNLGTVGSTNTFIEITLDEFLTINSSPIAFSSLGNNTYSFDVEDLAIGECNSFEIIVDVSCNTPLGITHCARAHIFPDNSCEPIAPQWSGASLQISGECNATNDSIIFTIRNNGMQDMLDNSVYIVIEDAIMLQSPTPLTPIISGGERTFTFPANGATYRMEVDQVAFHPGVSMPSATVEGCTPSTSNFSTGFVNQFSQNDADPFIAIDCRQNTGAVFENSKEASPLGFGNEKFIEPNTDIEYLIRFQNTGTDDVVDMTIRDTSVSYTHLTLPTTPYV